jgi:Cu/Ag efflux protein CusF
MTGLVLNVNSEKGTISVANDDIPGFMQPMVMTYKVRKTEDLGGVKRGQEIHATVVNKGDDWQLDRLTTSDPPR